MPEEDSTTASQIVVRLTSGQVPINARTSSDARLHEEMKLCSASAARGLRYDGHVEFRPEADVW
jgi:hypothetical protein